MNSKAQKKQVKVRANKKIKMNNSNITQKKNHQSSDYSYEKETYQNRYYPDQYDYRLW